MEKLICGDEKLSTLDEAYWTFDPSSFSPATIVTLAGRITTNVQNQAERYVKPAVPDGVFIDTGCRRTNHPCRGAVSVRAAG